MNAFFPDGPAAATIIKFLLQAVRHTWTQLMRCSVPDFASMVSGPLSCLPVPD
jgi:hypothetical protein